MIFIDLPTEIIQNIGTYCLPKEIVFLQNTCKTLYREYEQLYPYSKTLLGSVMGSHHRIIDPHIKMHDYFPYQELTLYSEFEHWSRVALWYQKQSKENKLYDTIKRYVHRHVIQYADCSEQDRILNCNPFRNKVIVIQAFAGTGKTTTLVRYATQYINSRILYLAYNKSLANDAKERFSNCSNVHVMTLHAFALHHILQIFDEPFEINDIQVEDIIHFLKTNDVNQIQSFLNQYNQFINSDSLQFPNTRIEQFWNDIFNNRVYPINHDSYLKYIQMNMNQISIDLDYSIIMVDELQDCTNCMLSIVLQMNTNVRIFVGDYYQKLYAFKFVNNPYEYVLDHIPQNATRHRFTLNTSFRFGYDIMHATNVFLKQVYNIHGFKHVTNTCSQIESYKSICKTSNIYEYDFQKIEKGTVIICRYNINLLKILFSAVAQGKTYNIHGKRLSFDEDIYALQQFIQFKDTNQVPQHALLRQFTNVDEFEEYVHKMRLSSWKTRLSLYNMYESHIIPMMERAKLRMDSTNPDILLSTAHQSKGCEFSNVIIHNDFLVSNADECNVLYVALTRAKRKVYVNHKVERLLKKAHGNIYYPSYSRYNHGSKKCDRCKSIMTNQLITREADDGPIFNQECEVHIIEYICQSCKLSVLP